MSRLILASLLALSLVSAGGLAETIRAEGLAVDVRNGSEPVLCAEKDNVTLDFASPEVRSFRIEATHPPYIGMLARDSFEADWTECDLTKDPSHASDVKAPTRQTLYEEPEPLGRRLEDADVLASVYRDGPGRRPCRGGITSRAGLDDPSDGR